MAKIKMGGIEFDLDCDIDPTHDEHHLFLRILAEIKHHQHQQKERDTKIMTAIENLNQSVSDLTAVVTLAVADISTPHATDAQVQAASDAVNSNRDRLNAALNPPNPPTTNP